MNRFSIEISFFKENMEKYKNMRKRNLKRHEKEKIPSFWSVPRWRACLNQFRWPMRHSPSSSPSGYFHPFLGLSSVVAGSRIMRLEPFLGMEMRGRFAWVGFRMNPFDWNKDSRRWWCNIRFWKYGKMILTP